MKTYVDSEIGHLRSVLMGSIRTFKLHEPINVIQTYHYLTDPPCYELLMQQQEHFVKVLENYGVEIYWVTPRSDSPNQINTRDVATVIGETFVVTAMKEKLRQNEALALEDLLRSGTMPILRVNAGVVEGGDIMLDGNELYVGLSERTNEGGLKWLNHHFSKRFHVVPLKLRSPFLHLDVVFNIASEKIALVCPEGLQEPAMEVLSRRYRLIEVTDEEQKRLATNVLALSPKDVVADSRNKRVNDILRNQGINVIEVDFSEVTKIGGSFRCATCPLNRDSMPVEQCLNTQTLEKA
jgi:N-dimethylarginine dimethylaminohydrolase